MAKKDIEYVNKGELVSRIAEIASSEGEKFTKGNAQKALEAFQEAVVEILKEGKGIKLVGFGNFEITETPEREGRNPKTSDTVIIPAHKQPKFKFGKQVKEAVK